MSKSKVSSNIKITIPLLPIVIFVILLFDKLYFYITKVDFFKDNGFPSFMMIGTVFMEDIGLLSIIVLLLNFLQKIKVRFICYIFYLVIFLVMLLYFFDSQLFQALFERLTIAKLYEYAGEFSAIASFISIKHIIILIITLLILFFIRDRKLQFKNKAAILVLLFLPTISIMPYINIYGKTFDVFFDGFTANVLRINQRFIFDQGVKPTVLQKMRDMFPDLNARFIDYYEANINPNCGGYAEMASTGRPNIIMLISESLSQVDSMRSGGAFNRLKRIDQMQSDGITLKNVVSNGSGTADALAALLLGIEPLPTTFQKNDLLRRFPPRCQNLIEKNNPNNDICERVTVHSPSQ